MKKRSIVVCALALMATAMILMALRLRGLAADPADIGKLIDRADKLIVIRNHQKAPQVVFASTERHDLDALKASLQLEIPSEPLHCMCRGNPAIVLYAGEEAIGQISNHHGKLVRFSHWKSDAHLIDAEAFLNWFDERNIPEPRQEAEKATHITSEEERNEHAWLAAMPASLQPMWPAQSRSFNPNIKPLQTALAQEFPEKEKRILALFSWYGSGTGYWSGYPVYEEVAEKMLLDYPTIELLEVLEGRKLTESETEGAARLFASWDFSQKRPEDLGFLSMDLRKRLLKHSLSSKNEDKRDRAMRAFGKQVQGP